MFKLVVVTVLAISAVHVQALPGGYLAKGGVVNFQRPLDYMHEAVNAGK